jgi:hypothetical protein
MSEPKEKTEPKQKTKRIWVPQHLYIELGAYAKATHRTVEETVNDLLWLGMNALDVHMRARKILKEGHDNGKER